MTTVMTVDDDTDINFLLKRILKKAGYDVIQAESGEEALELLKEKKPDLILLDVMMPGLDGWETLKKIRESEGTKDIPVLMVTVKGEEEDRERSFESLADGHIAKPIVRDKLLATVDWILKNKARRGY